MSLNINLLDNTDVLYKPSNETVWSVCLVNIAIGIVLFQLANSSFEPALGAVLFLFIGFLFTYILMCNISERNAFLLTFSFCLLIGGVSQYYSQTYFETPMSTLDANTFYKLLQSKNGFYSFAELEQLVNAPLAVYVWQYVYGVFGILQLDKGPWIGVLFNALLVGISAIFTVKAASNVFQGDEYRLQKVGVLFALCGMFWLYGALFLRDSFVLLTNSVAIWTVTKLITRLSAVNVVKSLIILAFCALAMIYLRDRAVYIIALFLFIGIAIIAFRKSSGLGRVLVILFFCFIVLFQAFYMNQMFSGAVEAASHSNEAYTHGSQATSGSQSLGVSIIVNQSLPVKAVLGSIYLLVFPVPIWGYLQPGLGEYSLIRGWHALYMAWLVPLFLAGMVCTIKQKVVDSKNIDTLYFMVFVALLSLVLVSVTSLESRHFGQFLPALIILAALPDGRRLEIKKLVNNSRILWFSLIAAIHFLWFALRT